jgi:diaminohydroxyphosphoribosylaminopyrimidine deaminase/5-amino-6-(5-phosphoribosylamino)uracil reductase
LAATALGEGCVQQVAAVIAPKLLGGLPARTPLGELGLLEVPEACQVGGEGLQQLGPDLLWQLEIKPK